MSVKQIIQQDNKNMKELYGAEKLKSFFTKNGIEILAINQQQATGILHFAKIDAV